MQFVKGFYIHANRENAQVCSTLLTVNGLDLTVNGYQKDIKMNFLNYLSKKETNCPWMIIEDQTTKYLQLGFWWPGYMLHLIMQKRKQIQNIFSLPRSVCLPQLWDFSFICSQAIDGIRGQEDHVYSWICRF